MSRVTAARAAGCEGDRVVHGLTARAMATVLAAACLLALACALPENTPTEPEPVQSVAPAPTADPNASPTPEPGGGEGAGACGSPLPPALSRLNVKVHLKLENAWVLDSTPLVGPDAAYCAKVGFPDRSICPVRPEGHAERSACELYVTGRAVDTGRPGPTWYRGSSFCTGPASGCSNHDENQYLLVVHTSGSYRACGRNGVCGEVDVN